MIKKTIILGMLCGLTLSWAEEHNLKDKVTIEKQEKKIVGVESWAKKELGHDIDLKVDWSTFKRGFSEDSARPEDKVHSELRTIVTSLIDFSKTTAGKDIIAKIKSVTLKNVDKKDDDATKEDVEVKLNGTDLVVTSSYRHWTNSNLKPRSSMIDKKIGAAL